MQKAFTVITGLGIPFFVISCYASSSMRGGPEEMEEASDVRLEDTYYPDFNNDRLEVTMDPSEAVDGLDIRTDMTDILQEDDYVPPEMPCLPGPLALVPYDTPIDFGLPAGDEDGHAWVGAVMDGDEILAAVVVGDHLWGPLCFIRFLPDLRQVRSSAPMGDLNPGQLVRLESGLAMFNVGNDVHWGMIRTEGEFLLESHATDGYDGIYEWTMVGAVPGGGFIVLWNQGWEIHARGYEEDGTPRGDPVLTTTDGRYPYFIDHPHDMYISYHGTGVRGPVVQRIDLQGNPAGELIHPGSAYDGDRIGIGIQSKKLEWGIAAVWYEDDFLGPSVRYATLDTSTIMPVMEPLPILPGFYYEISIDGVDNKILAAATIHNLSTYDAYGLAYAKVMNGLAMPEDWVIVAESTMGIWTPTVVYTGSDWVIFWNEWADSLTGNTKPRAVRIP